MIGLNEDLAEHINPDIYPRVGLTPSRQNMRNSSLSAVIGPHTI